MIRRSGKNCFIVHLTAVLSMTICTSRAQMIGFGSCPSSVTAVREFNANKFAGTWYEHSKTPVSPESSRKCESDTYVVYQDGTIDVLNNYTVPSSGKQVSSFSQTLHQLNPSGKLVATFSGLSSILLPSDTPFWVLGVEYDSWAVVYSCSSAVPRLMNMRYVWILTRERDPDQSVIKTALAVLDLNGINRGNLKQSDQTDCDS